MQAVILVGGMGTRLRPLTYETPKQMLPLVGVPMIECVLESLARHGVTDAILSLGYLPDRFTEAYPANVISGVRVTYAVESEPLDTAGAIRFAAGEADVDETFLVVNGDVVTSLDVTKLLDFHRSHGGEATIALHPVEDPSHFGVVPTSLVRACCSVNNDATTERWAGPLAVAVGTPLNGPSSVIETPLCDMSERCWP